MVKKAIYEDEWYPVLEFSDADHGESIEVPISLVKRWERCEANFSKIQEEMRILKEESSAKDGF